MPARTSERQGKYNDLAGQGAETECKLCAARLCNDQTGSDEPLGCKYNTLEGQDEEADCELCPKGTYNGLAGQGAASGCKECAAVKFGVLGGSLVSALAGILVLRFAVRRADGTVTI